MAFDIDSRELSEMTDHGSSEFLPKADFRARVTLAKLEPFEGGTPPWIGWWVTVKLTSIEPGKENPCFAPLPVEGREYKLNLKRFGNRWPEQNDRDAFTFRQLLASAFGFPHTPDLRVGELKAALESEGADFSKLKEFTLISHCSPSKPSGPMLADGTTPNPNAGRIYPNQSISFTI